MMYKIINKNSGDEFICNKVTIEGFDYYHTLEKGINSDNGFFIFKSNNQMITSLVTSNVRVKTIGTYYKVIATTNPNIECNLIIGLDSDFISLKIKDGDRRNCIGDQIWINEDGTEMEVYAHSDSDVLEETSK